MQYTIGDCGAEVDLWLEDELSNFNFVLVYLAYDSNLTSRNPSI